MSDLVREPFGRVAARIAQVGEDLVCTSIVVVSEIRYGAAKKRSARITDRLENILRRMTVLPFDSPADQIYGVIRANLERQGLPIGHFDYLIAAHALAEGCTVVTDNEREFSRVEGLTIENWLR